MSKVGKIGVFLIILCLCVGGSQSVSAHKFHVSVTHIEYNAAEQNAEIVIRVFADDLENAIGRHSKRSVKVDPKNKEAVEIIAAYLRESFELKGKSGRQAKINWVGIEGQTDVFWLYLEAKMPGGLAGAQVRNRVFCELFEDQVNIVNTRHQGKQIGVMFEPADDFKIITGTAKK